MSVIQRIIGPRHSGGSETDAADLQNAITNTERVDGGSGPSASTVQQRVLLSPEATVLLDSARAAAAFYVVLHHVSGQFGALAAVSILFRFGQEAVIRFFLISGFVIHANERERALRPRGYYLRRLRRIYPVLIAAMMVSAAVMLDNRALAGRFSLSEMAGTLLGLQDLSDLKPGVIVGPFLGNSPLWSLSYELAFYAVYPFVLRAFALRPALTTHAIGLICSLSFMAYVLAPNHFLLVAAYFAIWWTGAVAAEAYAAGARSWRALEIPLAWLGILSLLALGAILLNGFRGVGVYPALMLRHFVVAALMSVLAFGPLGRSIALVARHVSGLVGRAAGISYGVYSLHYPLMVQWGRLAGLMGRIAALMLLLASAWLIERRLPQLLPAAPKG